MRTTTGLFLPNNIAEAISKKESDYALRTSPVLTDIVLPRFVQREDWIRLCHNQGYGVNSHLAWDNAKRFEGTSPLVELAYGGN